MGIFPWNEPEGMLLWWHPLERAVLKPQLVKISKSSRNLLNQGKFQVTFNRAFKEVMAQCKSIQRPGQDGTWITEEHQRSFQELHELGYAHSIETWQEGELVGGLYGLSIGSAFFGESMFSKTSNASKIAFIRLAQRLSVFNYSLIDCQVYNQYLGSLGAVNIPREAFQEQLKLALKKAQDPELVFDRDEQF